MLKKILPLLLAVCVAAGICICVCRTESVYAEEQNCRVTISFDTQGGMPISDITMEQSTRLTYLPVPYKSGYIFQGWYTGVNGTGMALVYGAVIDTDVTYYAYWTPVNKTLTGISASIGSTPYAGDSVLSMLVVYAEYADGSYERIYDYSVSQTLFYSGSNSIMVSYRGFTHNIHIDVNTLQQNTPAAAALTGIEAVYTAGALPAGTYDTFAGLVVNACYSDGTTRIAEGYTLSSHRIVKGTNKITVAYRGKTADFYVTGYVYAQLRLENAAGISAAWITEDAELLPVLNNMIPSKEGYSFAGWYLDEACTQKVMPGMKAGTGKSVYAKWEQIYSWSLNKTEAVMKKGKKQVLSVAGLNSSEITWKSSDSTVASVSSNGIVKAKKKGTAVVTAVTKDGTVMTCRIKVK